MVQQEYKGKAKPDNPVSNKMCVKCSFFVTDDRKQAAPTKGAVLFISDQLYSQSVSIVGKRLLLIIFA